MIVIISRTTFDCTLLHTAQRWELSVFSPLTTVTIVNTLDRKLVNHTSVHCAGGSLQSGFPYANVIYVQNLIFQVALWAPEHFSYIREVTMIFYQKKQKENWIWPKMKGPVGLLENLGETLVLPVLAMVTPLYYMIEFTTDSFNVSLFSSHWWSDSHKITQVNPQGTLLILDTLVTKGSKMYQKYPTLKTVFCREVKRATKVTNKHFLHLKINFESFDIYSKLQLQALTEVE